MSNDKTLATAKHGGCVKLGTPGSRWAASGEPDPHGSRYDCERAALAMGDLTDDELANAVFMHGNERQTMAELVGGATPAIAYLTAAKDRIRWLSRALAAAEALSAQPSPGGQGDELPALPHPNYPISKTGLQNNLYTASQMQDYARTALAARQPVGEPVAYTSEAQLNAVRVSGDGIMSQRNAKWRIPLYTAPPAQAVDLGAVREALQAAEGLATICASVDGYSREEVAASGRAMRQQFADALAKVDSKAAGK